MGKEVAEAHGNGASKVRGGVRWLHRSIALAIAEVALILVLMPVLMLSGGCAGKGKPSGGTMSPSFSSQPTQPSQATQPTSKPSEQPTTQPTAPSTTSVSRGQSIPATRAKALPSADPFPPVLRSDQWQAPIPLPGPINTAGAEDSPFVSPDGKEFYVFFTPDPNVPPQKQLLDGVTGIWRATRSGETWTEPERVLLSDTLALDGCPTLQGETLWFASVRAGSMGEIDVFTARRGAAAGPTSGAGAATGGGGGAGGGAWTKWENAGAQLNKDFDIDEFHVTADGMTLYFHSSRPGGYGGLDIWMTQKTENGTWGTPANLGPGVNTAADEGRPFLTSDGRELWFDRPGSKDPGPAVYRSVKAADGKWGIAQEVISRFAAEPTLDDRGNIYFVHHYFTPDGKTMVEADIYVAYRK